MFRSFFEQAIELILDLENVGNMLNDDLGKGVEL